MDFATFTSFSWVKDPLQLSFVVVAYYLAKAALEFLHTLYAFFLRPGKNLRSQYGGWAVVTGATDGIGQAMAMEFARKGLNVLIISRTESKLQATKEMIVGKYPNATVEFLAIDYSRFDKEAQAKVAAAVKDKDVGVLVNNVGQSYKYARYFHELSADDVDNMVELNVNSTGRMTYIILEGMLERKRGAIVNMSSSAARNPTPLLAQYAGTKGYVEHFSESLHSELKGKGIHVQVQSPLFVQTKLASIRKASLDVPSPQTFAKSAVAHIGYEIKVSPYWVHALMLTVLRNLPEWLMEQIVMGKHLSIRKRGKAKDAKRAKGE